MSSGTPSEKNCDAAVQGCVDFLNQRGIPNKEIILHGPSLASGVAVELASRENFKGLILISGFRSLVEIGQQEYPWLPLNWLMKDRYESIQKIAKIKTPTIVLHSPNDDVIPFEHGQDLFKNLTGPKNFYTYGENDTGRDIHNYPYRFGIYTIIQKWMKGL